MYSCSLEERVPTIFSNLVQHWKWQDPTLTNSTLYILVWDNNHAVGRYNVHPLEDAFSYDASRFLWKKAHNVLYLGMYLISITYLSASNQSYIPHLNHVKTYRSLLSILQLFLLFLQNTFHTSGWRQSKNTNTIEERRSKIRRNSVCDCQLSPHWRQMAIKNTVSINFSSTFVNCWLRFWLPPTRCVSGQWHYSTKLSKPFFSSLFRRENMLCGTHRKHLTETLPMSAKMHGYTVFT